MLSMTEATAPDTVDVTGRPLWMTDARCRDVPTEVFFDESTQDEAIRCCAGCAVRATCLAYALAAGEPDGVWGGMTARRRRRLIERGEDDGTNRHRPGPVRAVTDAQLREIFTAALPDEPALPQLRERIELSSAGAYLYLARARALGLVERRGRQLYPAR